MKTRTLLMLFFVLGLTPLFGQIAFQRSYGGLGSDYGRSIIACSSGGYLLIGSTNSYFEPSTDAYFLRLDENGNYLWGKSIGFENKIEWGTDLVEGENGKYYAVGYTNNTIDNSYDGLLMEINDAGEELIIHQFEKSGWEFIYNVVLTDDNDLVMAGTHIGLTGQDGFIQKRDLNGNLIWETLISDIGEVSITGIDQCANEYIVFVGESINPTNGIRTMISGAIDNEGYIIWNQSYAQWGDLNMSRCTCIGDVDEPAILSIGTMINSPQNNLLITKMSASDGNPIWTASESQPDFRANAIRENNLGQILWTGQVNLLAGLGLDAVSYVFDSTGLFISSSLTEVQGGFGSDSFYDITPTLDGGYICVGETNSFGNNWQVLVSKITADGTSVQTNTDYLDITTPIRERSQKNGIVLYPNPAVNALHVQLEKTAPLGAQFEIRSLEGSILSQGAFENETSIEHLASGMFIYAIIDADGQWLYSQKFIKINYPMR